MFGMNFAFEVPRGPFRTQYRCFSVSMLPGNEREDLEQGGKIIMPPSALDQLTRLNIVYPMLFKLTNAAANRTTHCGVLEFVADEGKVYIPYWMMQNLTLEEGGLLQVESASLPVATFAKFQPHSVDFLDMTNPKAVLENRLRHFACLSKGDVVAIMYNNRKYEMSVLETKPAEAVSVIECDLNVDFAPPVGYQEPTRPQARTQDDDDDEPMDVTDLIPEPQGFYAFKGQCNRLDGKKRNNSETELMKPKLDYVRGIPDHDYEIGTLRFIRNSKPKKDDANGKAESKNDFEAFKGEGQSLRQAKSNKK
ncbi:ubiquitin recognition factor in ER-associated degradation protein 1-like isoform X2 [Tigriopus californicus]|nr:ubiquitin recognition factor in ER-associated degradation protein 1-like isoform X2 [Tigriopus californicus]